MTERCFAAGADTDALRLLDEHREGRRLEGLCSVPRSAQGSCWFRRQDRCDYRVKHGTDTLPTACTKFPYVGLLTPSRRLLGVSFACPASLALLARQTKVAPSEVEHDSVPTTVYYDFRGEQADGSAAAAEQFWAIHWSWCELLRGSSGSAPERLRSLALQASGVELPRPRVGACFWKQSVLQDELAGDLLHSGARREVVAALFASPVPLQAPLVGIEPCDEEALLNRYLDHRLLLPEFLLKGASLGRLLGVLFALVARFRSARANGVAPLDAIRHLDQLALHSDFVSQLFPPDIPEPDAWQSLAMTALADDA